MVSSARLLTSVSPDVQTKFTRLAESRGVSNSKLLGLLVEHVLQNAGTPAKPGSEDRRLRDSSSSDPATKYTIRLQSEDAGALERRAEGRGMSASSYAAHVVRSHLRANPPVPYEEYEQFKRVLNELGGIRAALNQLVGEGGAARDVDSRLSQAVTKLMPALKSIREDVQDALAANARSWETPDAQ